MLLGRDRHLPVDWRLVETTNHVTGVGGYSYGDSAVLSQFVYREGGVGVPPASGIDEPLTRRGPRSGQARGRITTTSPGHSGRRTAAMTLDTPPAGPARRAADPAARAAACQRYDRNTDASSDDDCLDAGGSRAYYYHQPLTQRCGLRPPIAERSSPHRGHRRVKGQDANWRTVALTGEDGQIVERVEYTAYGEPTLFGGPAPGGGDDDSGAGDELGNAMLVSTVGNPLLHQGLFRDRETLTYHNRFRQYDSRSGRFMQRDPATAWLVSLAYDYERSSPVARLDSVGLVSTSDWRGLGYFELPPSSQPVPPSQPSSQPATQPVPQPEHNPNPGNSSWDDPLPEVPEGCNTKLCHCSRRFNALKQKVQEKAKQRYREEFWSCYDRCVMVVGRAAGDGECVLHSSVEEMCKEECHKVAIEEANDVYIPLMRDVYDDFDLCMDNMPRYRNPHRDPPPPVFAKR